MGASSLGAAALPSGRRPGADSTLRRAKSTVGKRLGDVRDGQPEVAQQGAQQRQRQANDVGRRPRDGGNEPAAQPVDRERPGDPLRLGRSPRRRPPRRRSRSANCTCVVSTAATVRWGCPVRAVCPARTSTRQCPVTSSPLRPRIPANAGARPRRRPASRALHRRGRAPSRSRLPGTPPTRAAPRRRPPCGGPARGRPPPVPVTPSRPRRSPPPPARPRRHAAAPAGRTRRRRAPSDGHRLARQARCPPCTGPRSIAAGCSARGGATASGRRRCRSDPPGQRATTSQRRDLVVVGRPAHAPAAPLSLSVPVKHGMFPCLPAAAGSAACCAAPATPAASDPGLRRLDDRVDVAALGRDVGVQRVSSYAAMSSARLASTSSSRGELLAVQDVDRSLRAHHRDLRCRPRRLTSAPRCLEPITS